MTTIKIRAKNVKVAPNAILGAGRVQRGGTPDDNSFFEKSSGNDCHIDMDIGKAEIHGLLAAKDVKLMKKREEERSEFQGPIFKVPEDDGENCSGNADARSSINMKIGEVYVSPTGAVLADKYERNGDPNDNRFFDIPTNTDFNLEIGGGTIQGVVNGEDVRAFDD